MAVFVCSCSIKHSRLLHLGSCQLRLHFMETLDGFVQATHLLHTLLLLRPKITPPLHPSTQQPLPKRLLPPMIRPLPSHGKRRHPFTLILFLSLFPLLLIRKFLERFVELWNNVVFLLGLRYRGGARWVGGRVVGEALFPVGLER